MKEKSSESSLDPLRYLLVGNPNSGKSTLFNRLTGLRQKTGNFQGVTVEKKVGIFPISQNSNLQIWDLPGAFSLEGLTEDRRITAEIIQTAKATDRIIYVMDSVQIERSFQFLVSIIDLGIPIIVVLTMQDLLERRGLKLNLEALEVETGIRFISVNPKSGQGIDQLKKILVDPNSFSLGKPLWDRKAASIEEEYNLKSMGIKKVLSRSLIKTDSPKRRSSMESFDSILMHPVYGLGIFLGIMALIFQFLFSWSELPMEWIEEGIGSLQEILRETLPEGPLFSLLIDGAMGGVGAVLVFIPQISLLFFFIGVMEESGYMARASFVMDKIMGKFGLSGKSFIPLISSAACAVPAIMGTRTIENRSDRMTTIMISPLIMCSARYPVYILVVGTVFASDRIAGILSVQGLALFSLFLLGMITSLTIGLIFKKFVFKEASGYFIMELPEYRSPSLRSLFHTVWMKVKSFLLTAGQIILYISILLWFISYYPLQTSEEGQSVSNIKTSYAASIGKTIEPLIEPLGFDWKIGISLITSFAAREVMVSTLAIIYELEGEEEDSESLREAMKKDTRSDGTPLWTPLTGFSILVFFAFASQCMSTLAVVRRETNSYFWPGVQFLYMTGLAYTSSLLVYQIGRYFF